MHSLTMGVMHDFAPANRDAKTCITLADDLLTISRYNETSTNTHPPAAEKYV